MTPAAAVAPAAPRGGKRGGRRVALPAHLRRAAVRLPETFPPLGCAARRRRRWLSAARPLHNRSLRRRPGLRPPARRARGWHRVLTCCRGRFRWAKCSGTRRWPGPERNGMEWNGLPAGNAALLRAGEGRVEPRRGLGWRESLDGQRGGQGK